MKNKIPAYALIFCIAVQNVSFFYNDEQSIFLTDRFQATAWEDSISEKKAILEQVLILDQNTNNPWENTVATYNAGDLDIALAIPTGFAVNSMMDGTINKNAGYAVVGKNDDISFSDEVNKPTNLKFIYEGEEYQSVEELGDILSSTISANANPVDKTKTFNIGWEWKYETGLDQNSISQNDIIDTQNGTTLNNYTFNVIVSGTQVEPTSN